MPYSCLTLTLPYIYLASPLACLLAPPQARLAEHRARGGRIPCRAIGGCGACFHEAALARALPVDLYDTYRAARDETVEAEMYRRAREEMEASRSSNARPSNERPTSTFGRSC